MVIFVDIDETICSTPESDTPDYEQSIPCYQNIAIANDYYDQGNTVVYWTARGAKTGIDWRKLTERQLQEWDCKYHELRLDKPYYDMLFDDKAYQFPKVK